MPRLPPRRVAALEQRELHPRAEPPERLRGPRVPAEAHRPPPGAHPIAERPALPRVPPRVRLLHRLDPEGPVLEDVPIPELPHDPVALPRVDAPPEEPVEPETSRKYGMLCTALFMVVAVGIAPLIQYAGGIWQYLQQAFSVNQA